MCILTALGRNRFVTVTQAVTETEGTQPERPLHFFEVRAFQTTICTGRATVYWRAAEG